MKGPGDYHTPSRSTGPVDYVKKKSKFQGYTFPSDSREVIALQLENLKRAHPHANHICYAYRIGLSPTEVRAHDDGEPTHSAGTPILSQIESSGLENVLVCVVRYFGGTKLGVGGLIRAYRETARLSLAACPVSYCESTENLALDFEYRALDAVMRLIDQKQLTVVSREMGLTCHLELNVPLNRSGEVRESLAGISGLKVSKVS